MWVEVLCWIERVRYSKECAYGACIPSVHISGPLHRFCLYLSMSEVIFLFSSLRAGSQVFCSPYVIFNSMWSGKSL